MDASLRQLMEPRTPKWLRRSGWVRYPVLRSSDGLSVALGDGVPVQHPEAEDSTLVFDVEVMVKAGPFAVMATAAGANAWYTWLSPWLLGDSERKDHLISFGNTGMIGPPKLLVGHNVGFDRARILDEYSLKLSNIRFLDTQSLHVAVRGISSPQRPVWIQHRKMRAQRKAEEMLLDEQLREEQREELRKLLRGGDMDDLELAHFDAMGLDLEALTDTLESIPAADSEDFSISDFADEARPKRLQWQDISSTNSLAEVAALHCNIQLPKGLRSTFVEATSREVILEDLDNLLSYCARDVVATQAVFAKVLPAFRDMCRHPATFAGVMNMGSPILPVDDEWLEYQARCEAKYVDALKGVREALAELAESLREEHTLRFPSDPLWWQADPWLRQLDWSPKKPKKSRSRSKGGELSLKEEGIVPKWYRDYAMAKKEPSVAQSTSSHILLPRIGDETLTFEDGKWRRGNATLAAGKLTTRKFLDSEEGQSLGSDLGSIGDAAIAAMRNKADKVEIAQTLRSVADALLAKSREDLSIASRASGLDWTLVPKPEAHRDGPDFGESWPKWYWDLYQPSVGRLELTIRTKVAPLLLKISWRGCPLFTSREHGWVYLHRPLHNTEFSTRQKPLSFFHEADESLRIMTESLDDPAIFYKVPHTSGEDANVGSPFGKSFIGFFDDRTLRSEHPEELGKRAARDALDLNAQCSYWIAVRDRVSNQMVVWDGEADTNMGFAPGASGMRQTGEEAQRRKGLILPQVITMGTVTRRAIEKTWLTASNAKKNRVGSELKSMVKAPPGWLIVGADVDSEELWICSVMGDAQFGVHGATAIGWMTLEGTKAAGTDLHSKTASILGTTRNQAKVFNYSRIYGAGIRHATQLLLKANPAMASEEAARLAKELYASTKGTNTHSPNYFGRKFWYGGTESFVFNKLEDVALSEYPRTPALDCGITAALSRKFLPMATDKSHRNGVSHKKGTASEGGDFMPSRINWVVQSSGVDYLHLLVTSMDHLCRRYDIQARFMLSVHDEVRYLAKEEDAHRTALALQVANLWTRAMFAFKLQMQDLPEGVAWFAQVDLDKVLRKEVDDPCVTPSQPKPVPVGRALDIHQILAQTNGGSLHRDGSPMVEEAIMRSPVDAYPPYQPSTQVHRSLGERGILFLQAQASDDIHEVHALERRAQMPRAGNRDIDRVKRPDDDELAEMAFHGVGDKACSKHDGAKPRSSASLQAGGRSFRLMASSASPQTKRQQRVLAAAFCTLARGYLTATCNATGGSLIEIPLQDLIDELPPRVRGSSKRLPFYRDPAWKAKVRWQIYRQLLRQCPKDAQPLKTSLRRRFKKYRSLTHHSKAKHLLSRAEVLLMNFRLARQGDVIAQTVVNEEVRLLHERRQVGLWAVQRHQRILAALPPRPKPRWTGSLLPPSPWNVPLPRFKPVQPDAITMMIFQRRKRSERRGLRRAEIQEEQEMLLREAEFELKVEEVSEAADVEGERKSARGPSEAIDGFKVRERARGWLEPYLAELAAFKETARREAERASMRFKPEMLVKLKEVRRKKLEYRTQRKARLRLERQRANNNGECKVEASQGT